MANDRILITGGTGFAGSHLVEFLFEQGHEDVFVTTYTETPEFLAKLLPADHVHKVDLTNFEETKRLFQTVQPTHVYHLAAFAAVGKSFEKASWVLNNNITLQLSVMNAMLEECPGSRIMIVGSAEEYGLTNENELPISEINPFRPVNPYAVSKITQDLLAFSFQVSHKLDVVRVRPFNHIGERQSPEFVVSSFAQQIVAIERGMKPELHVGNLEAIRDFSDVKDMVRAYHTVMTSAQSGEVFNIGSGKGTKIAEILDVLRSKSTTEIKVIQDQARMRPLDIPVMVADPSAIQKLGWKTEIPLEDTLDRIMNYWRSTQ